MLIREDQGLPKPGTNALAGAAVPAGTTSPAATASPAGASAGTKAGFIGTYLDLVRVVAASMVVLFHFKILAVGPPWLMRALPGFGHEFVIVFFVLSGYVISWSVDRKRDSLAGFAADRAARILSVSIPLLLLSTAVSAALSLGGGLQMAAAFAANLVFVAQSWNLDQFPASNPPFWSLNYEVWYYALFGCAYYLRGWTRVFACAAAFAIAGPKVMLLLPCWLLGSAAYFAPPGLRRAGARVAVAALVALLALSVLRIGSRLGAPVGGLAQSAHFPKDYVTALLIAVHLYAMRHVRPRVPDWLRGAAAHGAAMTFTLYLVNYPMILVARALLGEARTTLYCTGLAFLMVCGATGVLARLTEAQTGRVKTWLKSRMPASSSPG